MGKKPSPWCGAIVKSAVLADVTKAFLTLNGYLATSAVRGLQFDI